MNVCMCVFHTLWCIRRLFKALLLAIYTHSTLFFPAAQEKKNTRQFLAWKNALIEVLWKKIFPVRIVKYFLSGVEKKVIESREEKL